MNLGGKAGGKVKEPLVPLFLFFEFFYGTSMLDNEDERVRRFSEKLSLSPAESEQLVDKFSIRRSLRAEKGVEKTAAKRLRKTLDWRASFGVEKLLRCFTGEYGDSERDIKALEEVLLEENATGKIYVRGKDKCGRACVIMRPCGEFFLVCGGGGGAVLVVLRGCGDDWCG